MSSELSFVEQLVTGEQLSKLRRGEPLSPEEAVDFFRVWHAAHPGATAKALDGRLHDGRTSYELLASQTPANADITVVDLACGDGPLCPKLSARLGPEARIIGIDVSETEIALARGIEHTPRITFVCALASATSLATASVDMVLCHFALMLFTPITPVVAEIARVLKPGGIFAAVVPSKWNLIAPLPELQAAIEEARRAELPGFPNIGLFDRRLHESGPAALFTRATGFDEPPQVTTYPMRFSWSRAAVAASASQLYWFSMFSAETQTRLNEFASALAARLPEPIELNTELQLLIAKRCA